MTNQKVIASSVILATLLWAPSTFAQQGIRPFVGVRYTADSNLFRVANDAEAIQQTGSSEMEDSIIQYFAGVEAVVLVSRQRFTANAQADLFEYDRNAQLNHNAYDARGDWEWQLGNLWSGTAGLGFREKLTEFNQSGEPVQDLIFTQTTAVTARFQFHPDWAVIGGAGFEVTEHDVQDADVLSPAQNDAVRVARARLDNTQDFYSGEVQYATTANTKVGLRTVFLTGDFERDASLNFEETEYSGVVYWEATGKSSLEARLGQTDREGEGAAADFSGSTGRLTYKWLVTEKTNLEFSGWQETRLVDDSAQFAVETGYGVSALLNATAKLRFRGSLRQSTDQYEGGEGSNREDDITQMRLAAIYLPTRIFTLTGSVVQKNRDSNIPNAEFETTILTLEGKLALR